MRGAVSIVQGSDSLAQPYALKSSISLQPGRSPIQILKNGRAFFLRGGKMKKENNLLKVYISGAITGDSDYKEKFAKGEAYLKGLGYKVFNPCCIPDIFEYKEFMTLDLTALAFCDAIYMLKDWSISSGAKKELREAERLGLFILKEE